MPATPAWLASVEAVVNRSIAESSRAAAAARRLNRTSVDIDVESVARWRIAVSAERLVFAAAGEADAPADAVISGRPLALLALLAHGAVPAARKSGAGQDDPAGRSEDAPAGGEGPEAARIRGNADIANRYRELLLLARPDLEEELSRWVGDAPARRVSRAARAALSWARKARHTAAENIAEYLTEESRDLVSRPELEEYLSGVDQLRESADRLEAKLGRLERRLRGEA